MSIISSLKKISHIKLLRPSHPHPSLRYLVWQTQRPLVVQAQAAVLQHGTELVRRVLREPAAPMEPVRGQVFGSEDGWLLELRVAGTDDIQKHGALEPIAVVTINTALFSFPLQNSDRHWVVSG